MSRKGFGPAHDRIDLTDEEMRVIGRIEHDLELASRMSKATAKNSLTPRSGFTARAHAYYLCMRYRRRAIWLLPLAGVALGFAITMSLALATLCAAAWTVGFAALLTEIGAQCRQLEGRYAPRSRTHTDPNAADGGR